MSKIIKAKTPPIATTDEFKLAVDQCALATREHEALTLKLEAEITKVRELYAGDLDELKKEAAHHLKRAAKFATLKRKELFPGEPKSSATTHGEYGFRMGNRTLTLCKGFEWSDVVETIQLQVEDLIVALATMKRTAPTEEKCDQLRAQIELYKSLITITVEPAKDNIKSLLSAEGQLQIGVEIKQAETFFITPKKEKEAV